MKTRKTLLAVLAMCFVLAFGMSVNASEGVNSSRDGDADVVVQSVNIDQVTAGLSISTNGVATCTGKVIAKIGKSCSITITLQKKSDSSWTNVKTWNTISGTTKCSITEKYTVSKGVSYRVKAVGKSGSETSTYYSDARNY